MSALEKAIARARGLIWETAQRFFYGNGPGSDTDNLIRLQDAIKEFWNVRSTGLVQCERCGGQGTLTTTSPENKRRTCPSCKGRGRMEPM